MPHMQIWMTKLTGALVDGQVADDITRLVDRTEGDRPTITQSMGVVTRPLRSKRVTDPGIS